VLATVTVLGAFLSSDPNGNSIYLGKWLVLPVVFLAIAAWPWWWSRVARLIRGHMFTGA
jgi:hypothetical protein